MYREWPSFDELMQLAKSSPDRLEEFRNQEIEYLISSAPKEVQRKLRGMQFRVNCERERHKSSSMGSCIALSNMMRDSLCKLNSALRGEHQTFEPQSNNVIPFVAS